MNKYKKDKKLKGLIESLERLPMILLGNVSDKGYGRFDYGTPVGEYDSDDPWMYFNEQLKGVSPPREEPEKGYIRVIQLVSREYVAFEDRMNPNALVDCIEVYAQYEGKVPQSVPYREIHEEVIRKIMSEKGYTFESEDEDSLYFSNKYNYIRVGIDSATTISLKMVRIVDRKDFDEFTVDPDEVDW